MTLFNIRQGKDLPIEGTPQGDIINVSPSETFAFLPPNFSDLKFKLEVAPGDKVKVGDPLLSSRETPELLFTSPAGGVVKEVKRGAKRKLLEIIVEKAEDEEFKEFKTYQGEELARAEKQELIGHLLSSGLWPYIIQRPFSRVASPTVEPKSIFVRAMDTAPNSADKQILIEGKDRELQTGISLLKRLTKGKVYLCFDGKSEKVASAISKLEGAEIHQFKGAHPTGNVGTHIHHLDPINKGDNVWHIDVEHLVYIGEFLLKGTVPVERVIALAGSQVKKPQYFKTRLGTSIESLTKGNLAEGENRILNGNVLSGEIVEPTSFLGYYNSTVTVIPEGGQKELFGWLKPGADKHSFTRLFLSSLFPGRKFTMDTKVNGEVRAIVATDVYDPLVTLDVYTNFLIKACIVKDVEAMEELGLLECAPEDFSLATYACVSKINLDSIIKNGLKLLESES